MQILGLLKKAFVQQNYLRRLSSTILSKGNLEGVDPSPDKMSNKLIIPEQWWMPHDLPKKSWPFWARVFIWVWLPISLLRLLIVIITLILEKVPLSDQWNFFTISGMFVDLIYPLGFILLNDLYNSLSRLCKEINEKKSENRIIPFILFDAVDRRKYSELYIPVLLKTNQLALDLAYDKRYQLGSAVIGAISMLILDPTKTVNPHSIGPAFNYFWGPMWFTRYEPWFYFIISTYLWSIVAMTAWTLFIIFLVTMSIGWNYVLEVSAHKPLRDYYENLLIVVSKVSRILVLFVTWIFPTIFFFQVLPPYWLPQVTPPEEVRIMVWTFSKWLLVIMIVVIALSLLLPYIWIHHGMSASRKIALIQLELEIYKIRGAGVKLSKIDYDRYQLLIEEYRSLRANQTWPINWGAIARIISSFILPILSFLLSSGVLRVPLRW